MGDTPSTRDDESVGREEDDDLSIIESIFMTEAAYEATPVVSPPTNASGDHHDDIESLLFGDLPTPEMTSTTPTLGSALDLLGMTFAGQGNHVDSLESDPPDSKNIEPDNQGMSVESVPVAGTGRDRLGADKKVDQPATPAAVPDAHIPFFVQGGCPARDLPWVTPSRPLEWSEPTLSRGGRIQPAGDRPMWVAEYTEGTLPLTLLPGMHAVTCDLGMRSDPWAEPLPGPCWRAGVPPPGPTAAGSDVTRGMSTALFDAAIAWHSVSERDLVLIETGPGSGEWEVAPVLRVATTSQTRPRVQVPPPSSREVGEESLTWAKLVMHEAVRGALLDGSDGTITDVELERALPGFSTHYPAIVRETMGNVLKCARSPFSPGAWTVSVMSKPLTDAEAQGVLSPVRRAQIEACMRGWSRLASRGVTFLVDPREVTQLRAVLEDPMVSWTLPPRDPGTCGYGDAVKFAEDTLRAAPWYQTLARFAERKAALRPTLADPEKSILALGQVGCVMDVCSTRDLRQIQGPMPVQTMVDNVALSKFDLRKMRLETAKDWLRQWGVRDYEMADLARWDIIGLIKKIGQRELDSASRGDDELTGFARPNMSTRAYITSLSKEAWFTIREGMVSVAGSSGLTLEKALRVRDRREAVARKRKAARQEKEEYESFCRDLDTDTTSEGTKNSVLPSTERIHPTHVARLTVNGSVCETREFGVVELVRRTSRGHDGVHGATRRAMSAGPRRSYSPKPITVAAMAHATGLTPRRRERSTGSRSSRKTRVGAATPSK